MSHHKNRLKALKLITFSFRMSLIFNFGVFISTIVYYFLLLSYTNSVAVGSFNYVLIFYSLAVLFAGCLLASLSYYAHFVFTT